MEYKLLKRSNPMRRDEEKWYASPVNNGKITKTEITKEIVNISSLSRGDISNTIENLIDIVPKYLLNAKELDEESGLYYYEARYLDSKHGTFNSRDPLFEKYFWMSPYAYCMNNPLRYIDPTGMDLDVASNEESKNDILSIVNSTNRDRVVFNDNGSVCIDFDGLDDEGKNKMLKQDKGLSLINDMIESDKKMLYEASDVGLCLDRDGKREGMPMSLAFEGILNLSNFGKDSENGYTNRPREGYDGQVTISISGQYNDKNGNNLRISTVFHELAENYERTHNGCDYKPNKSNGGFGAHYRAAQREGTWFGNSTSGVVENYTMNRMSGFKRIAIGNIIESYKNH